MAKPRIDPGLLQQITHEGTNDEPIEAVFTLKSSSPDKVVPEPDEMVSLTEEILGRVEKESGVSRGRFNVFKHMGSFAISARPSFMKRLVSQPEIAGGISNHPQADTDTPTVRAVEKEASSKRALRKSAKASS
jgi:hypothetical protein